MNQEWCSLLVSDLFVPGTKEWNRELIEELFIDRDVEEILTIPVLQNDSTDIRVWHFSKNGIYSVKSGYRLLMDQLASNDSLKVEGNWKVLWSLHIPPKAKVFLWRACRDSLPNRVNLRRKGVEVSSFCVCCGAGIENCWHLFVSCSLANECWQECGLWSLVDKVAIESECFTEWFFKMAVSLDDRRLGTFSMVLWSLWKHRNDKLWNDKSLTAPQVVHRAKEILWDWLRAKRGDELIVNRGNRNEIVTWQRPPAGFTKCNVDAAWRVNEKLVGYGACIRDEDGRFLACRSDWRRMSVSVKEGEAWGLLETLQWVKSLGFTKVIFEMDAKGVVDAMSGLENDATEYGVLVEECRKLLSCESDYSLRFVYRQANVVAHKLARASHLQACPFVSFDIPDCIAYLVCLNE